tara:strand:- start:488 stop:985 length:498 start_codon:yes stop_codon:yes gene_type:complete
MRYQTLTNLFKTVTENHKADLTFIDETITDADTASEVVYPLILFMVPTLVDNLNIQLDQNNAGWTIELQAQELEGEGVTPELRAEILDRTLEYLRNIILEIMVNYNNQTSFTTNNLSEELDFTVSPPSYAKFINVGSEGLTGWQATFTITEDTYTNCTVLGDIFN